MKTKALLLIVVFVGYALLLFVALLFFLEKHDHDKLLPHLEIYHYALYNALIFTLIYSFFHVGYPQINWFGKIEYMFFIYGSFLILGAALTTLLHVFHHYFNHEMEHDLFLHEFLESYFFFWFGFLVFYSSKIAFFWAITLGFIEGINCFFLKKRKLEV